MKHPKILLVITDKQCTDAISAYKRYFNDLPYCAHHLHTPNIGRLIGNGYSFILSNSENPLSGSSRGCMFTGRYTIENDINYNNVGIDTTIPILGQWLTDNSDYKCFYCGKWHAGGAWHYSKVEGNRRIPGFTTIPISEYP